MDIVPLSLRLIRSHKCLSIWLIYFCPGWFAFYCRAFVFVFGLRRHCCGYGPNCILWTPGGSCGNHPSTWCMLFSSHWLVWGFREVGGSEEFNLPSPRSIWTEAPNPNPDHISVYANGLRGRDLYAARSSQDSDYQQHLVSCVDSTCLLFGWQLNKYTVTYPQKTSQVAVGIASLHSEKI